MEWIESQELKQLEKPPISREQLSDYAEASGDKNPIHLDESYAKNEAGLPGVIVHGMLSMAFMADHVRFNFPEKSYRLRRLKTKFRRVTFPGDKLSCGGTVRKLLSDGALVVNLWVRNQKGELTADGEAEVSEIK